MVGLTKCHTSIAQALHWDCPVACACCSRVHRGLDCSCCSAEHVFTARKWQKGRQGMLLARLHDTALARRLLVVAVHLKATPGAEKDQLREQQVGRHMAFRAQPHV